MSASTVNKSLGFGVNSISKTQTTDKNAITVNIEFENLKAEAKALGIDFSQNIKFATLAERIASKKLENLKAEATSIDIEFDENIEFADLFGLVQEKKGDN